MSQSVVPFERPRRPTGPPLFSIGLEGKTIDVRADARALEVGDIDAPEFLIRVLSKLLWIDGRPVAEETIRQWDAQALRQVALEILRRFREHAGDRYG